jgi:hypothetical protein
VASKKIVELRGAFFWDEKPPSTDHIYHAIHHKLTSEKPRPTTCFFQNTPKNSPNSRKYPPATLGIFSPQIANFKA